jgi:hypothetical protein
MKRLREERGATSMRKTIVVLAFLLLGGALMAQDWDARQRRGRARMSYDELKTVLPLTDDHIQDFQEIQRAFRESIRDEMKELSKLTRELRQSMRADEVDETLVSQLKESISLTREAIAAKHLASREDARALLTNEQIDLLLALEEELASRENVSAAARQALSLNLIGGTEGFGHMGRMFGRGMRRGGDPDNPRRRPGARRPPEP